jgi:hypothetical protein
MNDKEFEKELERDNISMKQEIMRESLAGLIIDFERYFKKRNIKLDDNKNAVVKNYQQIKEIYYDLFMPKFDSIKAMDEVIGYYKYTKKWLEKLENEK